MKKLKRIICFLLMIVSIGFFSACSKSETPPPGGGSPETENNGGTNGEEENNNDENDDNENNNNDNNDNGESGESGDGDNEDEENDEPQEVYVPYTSSEIMLVGSEFVGEFFNSYETDLTDENLFDDNIESMKILFLNASKMLKTISEIRNLPFNYCVKGKPVELENYEEQPNMVDRFEGTFSGDDANGNSSVKLKMAFSYNEKNVTYTYDYYEFFIQTNKAQNKVSCEISVERSVENGTGNSVAKYYKIGLSGVIGGGDECSSYNCYKFERTKLIEEKDQVNYNNIDSFEQSKFNGSEKYVGSDEAEILLRNLTSNETILVGDTVKSLMQGYKTIFSGNPMQTLSTLSNSLIVYVNSETEII